MGEKQAEKKEAPAEKPREVIYVDEQGNPVSKPPEPDKMLAEAERLIGENKFDEALPQLEKIRALTDITPEMREKVLYYISDCLWVRYADNPLAGYEAIVSSTNEALNANLRSPRVPDALLRLGLANANVGNLVDAGGYIVALLRRYPDYPGVAQGFTALGKEQLKRGLNAEAEQSFSIVLDKYPESSHLQTASVGLAQALFNQKKHDKAQIILDFISKRWPRYYIDEPSFLLLQAGNDEALQKTDTALDLYWLYVNLEPGRQGNDAILLKMGDTYLRRGKNAAADFIYRELARRFADSPLASTARLRLAEKGIYDSPITYEQMNQVFARGGEPPLWQTYSELAASSQTSPDAVLARLKQAMWLFWDKQYTEAMGKAADFIDGYPEHPDAPQAREIIWQAFQKELANSLAEQNYGRILILWNGFPLVRERYGEPDPRLRYALAQGWLERGNEKKAFELLGEFLKSPMDPQYGEAAFTEFFNRYLQAGAWDKILDEIDEKYQKAEDKYELNDPDFAAVPVNLFENFYRNEEEDHDGDGVPDGNVRVFKKTDEVNLACLMEGSFPASSDEIAVDRMHADNVGIAVGDTITVQGEAYRVVGLIAYVNYATLHEKSTDLMFDALKFNVAMVTEDGFARLHEKVHYDYAWNYVTEPADEAAEKNLSDDFMKALLTQVVVADAEIEDYVPEYANPAIHFATDDMGSDEAMGGVLLDILIVIIAFIFAITISNTIARESATIGTLRASGYTRGELVAHYLSMPVIVTLVAALIGNILGYTVFKNIVVSMYYNSYSLPTYETIWNPDAFIKTTLIPLILMFVVNLVVIARMMRHTPLQFLRHDLKKTKRKKAMRLPRFQFLSRFRLRVMLQNMANYAVLFVGIFFCMVMLAMAVGMPDTLGYYKENAKNLMFA